MTYKQSLVAAVLIAMTAACGWRDPQIPADAQEMGLLPVDSSQRFNNTGFTESARLAIRDQDAWVAAWNKLQRSESGLLTPPQVDFANELVLVAAMGWRSNGGYSIEIKEAAANAEALFVSVMETSPGNSCVTTDMVVTPAAVMRVARHDGEVRFLENETTHHCW